MIKNYGNFRKFKFFIMTDFLTDSIQQMMEDDDSDSGIEFCENNTI